jgi:dienelactone hydrolase
MPARAVLSALTLLVCWSAAGAQAQERVQVPSLDQTAAGVPVFQPGFWFASAAPDAAPAIVLLHGCGGPYGRNGRLSERTRDYAHWLNGLGVHVLVTDSLTPRGERELCTQRTGTRRITQTERRRDALGALQWLSTRPDVDATRLGLLGWSHGGSAVLASTNLDQPEVTRAPVKPSLAVAFYPGCADALKAGYRAAAPLLLMVGEADDWTPAGPCRDLSAQASGAPVAFEAYAGAYHGFDTDAPVRLRRDVPNGVQPGQGVHVGGDPAAMAASRERLMQFLRAQWQLP